MESVVARVRGAVVRRKMPALCPGWAVSCTENCSNYPLVAKKDRRCLFSWFPENLFDRILFRCYVAFCWSVDR